LIDAAAGGDAWSFSAAGSLHSGGGGFVLEHGVVALSRHECKLEEKEARSRSRSRSKERLLLPLDLFSFRF
jgi:hypothetical protein